MQKPNFAVQDEIMRIRDEIHEEEKYIETENAREANRQEQLP